MFFHRPLTPAERLTPLIISLGQWSAFALVAVLMKSMKGQTRRVPEAMGSLRALLLVRALSWYQVATA